MGDELLQKGREIQERPPPQMRAGTGRLDDAAESLKEK
jgi:hypothetical protein